VIIVWIGLMILVLPGIVAAFFLIFTLPAVLLDGRGPVDALKRSASLVRDNVGPVVGLIVGFVIGGIVVLIIAKILGLVPLLGQLAGAVLAALFVAYLTIVAVGVYQTLPRR
jgi:hypothetical protein